jgi:hypothetical protein
MPIARDRRPNLGAAEGCKDLDSIAQLNAGGDSVVAVLPHRELSCYPEIVG